MGAAYALFFRLIFSPAKGWRSLYEDGANVRPGFFANVCILSCMVLAVAIEFLATDGFTWQKGLGHLALNYLSLYAGLYLAALLIKLAAGRFMSIELSLTRAFEFSAYSSAFIYAAFITAVCPGSAFAAAALSIYSFQIANEGAGYFISKDDKHYNAFVMTGGLLMIASPLVIRQAILIFLPYLQ